MPGARVRAHPSFVVPLVVAQFLLWVNTGSRQPPRVSAVDGVPPTIDLVFIDIVGRKFNLTNGENLMKNSILKFRDACQKAGVNEFVLTGILGGICFNAISSRSWMQSKNADLAAQAKLAAENGDKNTIERVAKLIKRNCEQLDQLRDVQKAAEAAYLAHEKKAYIKPSKSSEPTQSEDVMIAQINALIKKSAS